MNNIFRLKKHKPKTEIISASDDAADATDVATKSVAAAAGQHNNSSAVCGEIASSGGGSGAKLILDAVRWEASDPFAPLLFVCMLYK